ncbi:glycosyltransferase family 4 protein [Aerococcus sanguinicola]|uniref:Glycosyl transferase family 1 n=1 Tax=Aerococcus sanguinicola TaxID=119206 RepID=A0A0X8FAF7_9LACT|nr:glycosyltransferase family 4 protein [Aerococcus sanguinicola]AMB93702.1 glycosyl transferase family 1 [Aerococcus sanguinicola]
MHILHINSYYSTTPLYQNLYDRQVASGMDLDVYVPIAKEFPKDRLAAKGDYCQIVEAFHQADRYVFHLKHYKIWKDLKRRYAFDQFDLVHAHSLFSNGWLAHKVYLTHHIPYIVAVRSADIRTFFQKMPWLRKLGLQILADAEQVVFISENSRQEVFAKYIPQSMQDELAVKTQVIANGIDDYWHANRYTDKTAEVHQPLRFVCTAKLLKEKQIPKLIRLVDYYHHNAQEAELHLIGPAWDESILAQVKDHPLVNYHGPKDQDGMRDLYRQMDIFTLVSSRETFGLVYVEAMSQGLPVIYTKGEGFDSYYPNYEVGASLNPDRPEDFVRDVQVILADYPGFCQRALDHSKDFSWDKISERYGQLYQKVLKA